MAEEKLENKKETKKGHISIWWMFAPVLLGLAGGLIAWKVHKDREERMARIMLVIGIVFTIIIIPLYILLLTLYL